MYVYGVKTLRQLNLCLDGALAPLTTQWNVTEKLLFIQQKVLLENPQENCLLKKLLPPLLGGKTYTATGFDIWNMSGDLSYRKSWDLSLVQNTNKKGTFIYPYLHDYSPKSCAPGYSIILHKGELDGSPPIKASYTTNPNNAKIKLRSYNEYN